MKTALNVQHEILSKLKKYKTIYTIMRNT